MSGKCNFLSHPLTSTKAEDLEAAHKCKQLTWIFIGVDTGHFLLLGHRIKFWNDQLTGHQVKWEHRNINIWLAYGLSWYFNPLSFITEPGELLFVLLFLSFLWQGFGSWVTSGMRSFQKLPLCPTEPIPACFKMEPLLAKSKQQCQHQWWHLWDSRIKKRGKVIVEQWL